MNHFSHATGTSLDHMLADIADAARAPLPRRHEAVADAMAPHLPDPQLLAGQDCPCCPDRYVRHLLHSDPAGEYAVVALVWRPGQMSPVHAHQTWCAFGIHQGILTEHHYDMPAADGELPAPRASFLRRPGEACCGAADPRLIHRLANLSCRTAVSIHVYGVGYDRFGDQVNQVWHA